VLASLLEKDDAGEQDVKTENRDVESYTPIEFALPGTCRARRSRRTISLVRIVRILRNCFPCPAFYWIGPETGDGKNAVMPSAFESNNSEHMCVLHISVLRIMECFESLAQSSVDRSLSCHFLLKFGRHVGVGDQSVPVGSDRWQCRGPAIMAQAHG